MTVNEMNSIPPQHFWGYVDIMDLYWLIWDCNLLLETVYYPEAGWQSL